MSSFCYDLENIQMPLEWKQSKPAPDPFEAIAGDLTAYQVHFADSLAIDDAGIETVIGEIVSKALGFSEANTGERAVRLLFLWDVVYATLTAVYTDESMMYDAHHVTKCYFGEIDKAGSADELSDDICQAIESCLAQSRGGLIPSTMSVFFSNRDRASVGVAKFKAQPLTNG
jgi:hypothetical protein